MFKRAHPDGRNEEAFIDIGERLAPYGDPALTGVTTTTAGTGALPPTPPRALESPSAPRHLVSER
jgi:hypothetical protein